MPFELISIQASRNHNGYSHKAIRTGAERKKGQQRPDYMALSSDAVEEESVKK